MGREEAGESSGREETVILQENITRGTQSAITMQSSLLTQIEKKRYGYPYPLATEKQNHQWTGTE